MKCVMLVACVCLLACWVGGASGMYDDGCPPEARCVPRHICRRSEFADDKMGAIQCTCSECNSNFARVKRVDSL